MPESQSLGLERPECARLPEKLPDDIPVVRSDMTSVMQSPNADHTTGPLSLQRRLAEIYPELVRQEGVLSQCSDS